MYKRKAYINIYVDGELKETVIRTVIHRLATPYARYEKQWHELNGILTSDGIRFCIEIERKKDNATA